jgi:hypothetical protein
VRAGVQAVPSRVAARLPHLSRTDIAEIDAETRAALSEIGSEMIGSLDSPGRDGAGEERVINLNVTPIFSWRNKTNCWQAITRPS